MNPLALASPAFWQTTEDIDLILAKTGSAQKPITPQLRRVSEIDIDELKRVATKVWGTEANTGPANSINWALRNVSRARTDAGDAWRDSDAAANFKKYLTNVENWLTGAEDPVKAVGPALMTLADTLELKLSDILTEVSLLGALAGAVITLLAIPEPVVTKSLAAALAVIGAVLTLIMAVVGIITYVVSRETKQVEAVDAAIKKLERVDRFT